MDDYYFDFASVATPYYFNNNYLSAEIGLTQLCRFFFSPPKTTHETAKREYNIQPKQA
jgi:hypothetical protein